MVNYKKPRLRREDQSGRLPIGGWAQFDAAHRAVWAKWHPRPVLINVHRWMKKDHDGHPHWYALAPHQFIQGLVAHVNDEQWVYVVTIDQLMRHVNPRVLSTVSIKGYA
jgi:hypothetical protein